MRNLKNNCGFSKVLALIVIAFLFILVFGGAFALYYFKGRQITTSDIASVEKIAALHFTAKERKMMLNGETQEYLPRKPCPSSPALQSGYSRDGI